MTVISFVATKLVPPHHCTEACFPCQEKQTRRTVNDGHHHPQVKLFPLLLLLFRKKEMSVPFWHKLNMHGRRRRQRGPVRECLLDPSESPWARPCNSANDGAMITVAGFNVATFQCLLQLFAPFLLAHTPWCGNQDGFTCKKQKSAGKRKKEDS